MSIKAIPSVSLWHNLRFNLCYVAPLTLQGLFVRQKFWVQLFSLIQHDPQMQRFCTHLRRHYQADLVYVRMLFTKTLLVLNHADAAQVLQDSPLIYGPPNGKINGMSHFQPGAVTLSTGAAWRVRRAYNDAALTLDLHADPFARLIAAEVHATCSAVRNHLRWRHLDDLFERITLQIVFGAGVKDPAPLTALHKMMRQANRFLTFRQSRHYDAFDATIRNALRYPPPNGLVSTCPHADATITRPHNQVPHWLFALRDTLAENTARALVAVLANPAMRTRINDSINGLDLTQSASVQSLTLLEASVQEAMRLWPSTPLLTRKTLASTVLGHALLPTGLQVIVPNNFLHRDTENIPDANQFRPARWQSRTDHRYNHLSNGPQVCAGKDLALFIAVAVIANLMQHHDWHLQSPQLSSDEAPATHNHYRLSLSI